MKRFIFLLFIFVVLVMALGSIRCTSDISPQRNNLLPYMVIENSLIGIRLKSSTNLIGSGALVMFEDEIVVLTAGHVAERVLKDFEENELVYIVCHLPHIMADSLNECVPIDLSRGIISTTNIGVDSGVLFIEGHIHSGIPLSLNSPPSIHLGDSVWAGGYGGGMPSIFSGDVMGRESRYVIYANIPSWLGSSGGPVINEHLEVIGVMTSLKTGITPVSHSLQVLDGYRGITLTTSKLLERLRRS